MCTLTCQLIREERFSTMSLWSVRTGGPYLSDKREKHLTTNRKWCNDVRVEREAQHDIPRSSATGRAIATTAATTKTSHTGAATSTSSRASVLDCDPAGLDSDTLTSRKPDWGLSSAYLILLRRWSRGEQGGLNRFTFHYTALCRSTRTRRHRRLCGRQTPADRESSEAFSIKQARGSTGDAGEPLTLTTKPKPFFRLISRMRPYPLKNFSTSLSLACGLRWPMKTRQPLIIICQ